MGAEVDKTEKSFFIIDKPELNLGAVAWVHQIRQTTCRWACFTEVN